MIIREDEPLWVEKYRPQTIADTILPAHIKKILQGYVKAGLAPNSTFSGGPGVGKTTAARAMFTEMKADYYYINGSLNGGIDTLRTDISDFASSVSFTGRRKYVLLDEADYLTAATQPALRGVIEEFSKNCGFILTCNYASRLIEPLHSRCPIVDFNLPIGTAEGMCNQFMARAMEILHLEGVQAPEKVVADIILKFYPDWRKVLNILQNSVENGKIGGHAITTISEGEIHKLYGFLKAQDFLKVREWAAQYGADHPKDIFKAMYKVSGQYLTDGGQAALAVLLNTHEYNAAFVANQEINLVAALAQVSLGAEFK